MLVLVPRKLVWLDIGAENSCSLGGLAAMFLSQQPYYGDMAARAWAWNSAQSQWFHSRDL